MRHVYCKSFRDIRGDWLEEIPDHWDCKKAYQIIPGIGSGTTPLRNDARNFRNGSFNWLLSGELNDSNIYSCTNTITQYAISNCKSLRIYPINSIAVAMYGATIGRASVIKFPTSVNQACCVFPPSPYFNPSYLLYCLISARPFLLSKAEGSGQLNIKQNTLKFLPIPIPPLSEQHKIVELLDSEIVKLSDLIDYKKKLIKLLTEKLEKIVFTSITKGINHKKDFKRVKVLGLESIPIDWSLEPIKNISNIQGRIGFRGYSTADIVPKGQGALSISPSNIINNRLNIDTCSYISWSKYYESPEIKVFEGDILLVKTASVGKVCFVDLLDQPATINPQMLIFKNIKINNRFLFFTLSSQYFQSILRRNNRSCTFPSINQEDIKEIKIPLPPLEEQQLIVQFLSEVNKKYFNLINMEIKSIKILKEKISALIYNYVTGKIDCSSFEISNQKNSSIQS